MSVSSCGARPGNGGDSRMAPAHGETQSTPLRRLDDIVAADPARSIMVKIDVQGAEPEVLAGGEATIAGAELVVVEFWPYGLRAMGHGPMALAERLLAWPGRAAVVRDEHKPQPIAWTSPDRVMDQLAAIAASSDPDAQVEIVLGAGAPA